MLFSIILWYITKNLFLSSCYVGLPGVLWVLPDSYIDVKNKDYGGALLYQLMTCCLAYVPMCVML
jgi:hypothetical protein